MSIQGEAAHKVCADRIRDRVIKIRDQEWCLNEYVCEVLDEVLEAIKQERGDY